MIRTKIIVVVIILIGLVVFVKCNFAEDSRQIMIGNVLKNLDKPFNYYGRVVDNNSNPVTNAKVYVQISWAGGVKDLIVGTDAQGNFEVADIGASLLVDRIVIQGYENLQINRANGHDGYENDGNKILEKNNPIIFHMRKKEPPTVVIPGNISVMYAKDVKFYEVDLKQMVDEEPAGLRRYHGDNAHADIKTRIEYSSVDDTYTFILETPDADSGIIALDQMLYALPEIGYKTHFKIKVPNNQSATTYLYVKSRGGQLYSRLDVKFAIEKEKVYFAAKVLTNPLGERNVDSDDEKYKEYLDKQDAEAKRMGPM